jgi:uncharacterized protein
LDNTQTGWMTGSGHLRVIQDIVAHNNSDFPERKKGRVMTNKDAAEPIYPCQFPIKVIGENTENLEKIIIEVMLSFGEMINPDEVSLKHSKDEKYLSITFKIVAKSKEHIEQIYSKLNAQKEVKMVL